nr:alkaline phosphatase family protein [Chloroflexia bacterium]
MRPVVRCKHWTLIVLLTVLALLAGPFATAQEATPEATPVVDADAAPMLMFASDGMRPDFVSRFSASGVTPAMAQLSEQGVVGDNGMLQAFPPNTGTGWATLSTGTWPGAHGSINNTFYRTGDADFNNSSSGFDAGVLQSQTIAQSAEQYGKSVVAVGWTGTDGLMPQLDGPAIDYWSAYSFSTVLANYDLGADAPYQQVTLAEASGWSNVPETYSPALEQQLTLGTNDDASNPERAFDLYIYDSTDDDAVNYDRLTVVPAIVSGETGTPSASPIASPAAVASGGKDGGDSVADLAVGDWQDVKVTLAGEMDGLTAGFHLKLLDLAEDASTFRIYATSIARFNATYNGCDYEDGCAEPTGFAEDIATSFPSATGSDYYPLEHGLIDEDTYVQQGLMAPATSELQLLYILQELVPQPDLLMVGAPVTDEFSHQFLALITENGPGGTTNPRFDDVENDGVADGRVELR